MAQSANPIPREAASPARSARGLFHRTHARAFRLAVERQRLQALREYTAETLRHVRAFIRSASRLGTRRLARGRPARRASSSTSSRGDPDLGDELPGHRSPPRSLYLNSP